MLLWSNWQLQTKCSPQKVKLNPFPPQGSCMAMGPSITHIATKAAVSWLHLLPLVSAFWADPREWCGMILHGAGYSGWDLGHMAHHTVMVGRADLGLLQWKRDVTGRSPCSVHLKSPWPPNCASCRYVDLGSAAPGCLEMYTSLL